jgi:four helix bundle protein
MGDGGWRMGTDTTMTPLLLLERLERFALDVLAATKSLCRPVETTDMARQLRRSGTGAYMNYGAASVARSHADFTSKLGVAFEEADESVRWLSLLKKAAYLNGTATDLLLAEAGELRAILSAAHRTAKRNRISK